MKRVISRNAAGVGIFGIAAGISLSVTGGSACSAIVHASDYTTQECAVNTDCTDAHGDNWICRKTDHTCQNLISQDCQTVLGGANLKDDDTILFGAQFALNGSNASSGKGEVEGLQLAYQDVLTGGNGLPPVGSSTKRRQIAVLICDDSAANDVALRSMQHMIYDLGIQGIVGPTWSGPAVNFLGDPKGSVAGGALVIASGTTSPALTTLTKGNPTLFYRTSESTAVEGIAMAKLADDLEAKLEQSLSLTKTKMALVYKGDAFGKGTAQIIAQNLTINNAAALDPNNAPYWLYQDYGNPSDPTSDPLKYADTVAKIVAQQPNIIIVSGTGEQFGSIMGPVESQWPTGVVKPYWIFSHIAVTGALLAQLKLSDPSNQDLRTRTTGITYGPNPHNPNSPGSSNFQQFLGEFAASTPGDFSPYTIDANTTYDAFFTLAFLTVANGANPLTGTNLSSQMPKLINGTTINVGPTDLNNGMNLLSQGQTIKLVGTSGPLDFDLKTGDVHQENQVWCVPLGKDNQPAFPPFSGYGFDLNNRPAGTIDLLTSSCNVDFNPPKK